MKHKGWLIFGIILAVVILLFVSVMGSYNTLVSERENVDNKWALVDTQLQRRLDLIPNLVNTVKGYAAQEKEIFTAIAEARTKLAGAQTPAQTIAADTQLSSALARLLVIVENYPNLKANENFIALQDELAGTENRIAVARKDYNDEVLSYNKRVKIFPSSIIAGMFGFEQAIYFEAKSDAQNPPKVDFNT